jgi:hypothetical protein
MFVTGWDNNQCTWRSARPIYKRYLYSIFFHQSLRVFTDSFMQSFKFPFRLDRESFGSSRTQNVLFLSLIYDGNKDVYQFFVKRRVLYCIKCLSFTIDKTCIGIVILLFDITTTHIN